MVKTLLYAYRVLLTGIHLLRTGEVEANLPRLAELYGKAFLAELIAQKRQEKIAAPELDWPFTMPSSPRWKPCWTGRFRNRPCPRTGTARPSTGSWSSAGCNDRRRTFLFRRRGSQEWREHANAAASTADRSTCQVLWPALGMAACSRLGSNRSVRGFAVAAGVFVEVIAAIADDRLDGPLCARQPRSAPGRCSGPGSWADGGPFCHRERERALAALARDKWTCICS